MTRFIVFALFTCACFAQTAQTTRLTLKEAVELALRQNPDVVLAHLDEQSAALRVRVVKEPLLPRVYAGSGLAYSNGFPMSIDGAAPSVVQARAVRTLYSRPQGFQVAAAVENERSAALSTVTARQDAALKTAEMFLDLEKTSRSIDAASRQLDDLKRIEESVRARIHEGKELEIEGKRAALNTARARQRVETITVQRNQLSESLAVVLGLNPAVRIEPASEERVAPQIPAGVDASVEEALKDNPELRRIESAIAAKNLEVKSFKAMRYPKVDLIAQYGLFAKFNNYTDYFRSFQSNNGEIGASISLPLFANPQDVAQAGLANVEAERLRANLNRERANVERETRRAWEEIHLAETANEIATMDLDVARDQVTTLLARLSEGKAALKDVDLARFQEEERWMQLYDARASLERAQFQLLRQTRTLVAALR